jgi:hypothetical protein
MRDLATRKQTLDTWDIQRTAHKTVSVEGETQEQTLAWLANQGKL